MITVTKVEVIDETSYNHIHCQQCNRKIGWKPRDERVHAIRLVRRSGRSTAIGMTCTRCKSNYLIATDGD